MESASAKEIKRQLQALRANIGENFKGLLMREAIDSAFPYFDEDDEGILRLENSKEGLGAGETCR